MYGVSSLSEQKMTMYYGEIRVNGEVVNVMFDTGSSEFWVAGSGSGCCDLHNCLDSPSSPSQSLSIEVIST